MNLDIFASDAFSVLEMSTAINTLAYKPRRLGAMGLFEEKGISTTKVGIEMQNGTLNLIPTQDRRAPENLNVADRRTIRDFRVPFIPLDDLILPDDVQNVRPFGSSNTLAAPAQIIAERLQSMKNKHEITLEHLRIGALKGVILDADGTTVIYDLFDEFDVTQEIVYFDLDNANADLTDSVEEVLEAMESALGEASYDHVHCMCGRDFFKKLVKHASVTEAYKRWRDGEFLRTDHRYQGFELNGVIFEQYRGSVNSTPFVDPDEAHFFPVGVPELFKVFYAPGNFMGAVNTIGQRLYARNSMLPDDRGVKILTESNPLPLATRPAALIKGATGIES